jgi:hypothetical protein
VNAPDSRNRRAHIRYVLDEARIDGRTRRKWSPGRMFAWTWEQWAMAALILGVWINAAALVFG